MNIVYRGKTCNIQDEKGILQLEKENTKCEQKENWAKYKSVC